MSAAASPSIAPAGVTPAAPQTGSAATGLFYAIATYAWWGLSPNYFKLIAHVPPLAVLCHRVVWSVLLLGVLLAVSRQWGEVRAILANVRLRRWLALTTLLIAVNWLVFIYSITAHRLVEASLGFFVNPLLTVVLGVVFLRERLRPAQWVAVALAGAALVSLTIAHAGLPWIALVLPLVFGFYSLIRKRTPVGPLSGLFVETALLAPLSVAYLAWIHTRAEADPINTPTTLAILSLAGVVTTVPLIWFIAATKRLSFTTLGFVQYINPILQFLTAVAIFHEPFGRDRLLAFIIIWVALGVFVGDAIVRARNRRG